MNDFWKNISRYPRFFISSLIGLISVILTPFKNWFKVKKFRIYIIIVFFMVNLFLFIIINKMRGF